MKPSENRERRLTVLLADDHTLFREGLCLLLDDLPYPVEVTQAGCVQDVLDVLSDKQFDLILLDLLMPGMDHFAGLRAVRSMAPNTPIAVISMLDAPSDVRKAIDGGAAGFVPKSSSPKLMLQAIEMILSGGVYLPPALLRSGMNGSEAQKDDIPNAGNVKLTRRQDAVLRQLAQGKSNKQIAYALDLSEATVKVHIAAIMRTLKAQNRTQVVLAATHLGLISEMAD